MNRGGFLKRAGLALGLIAVPTPIRGMIAEIEPQEVAAAETAGARNYGLVARGGLISPLYMGDVQLPRFKASAGGIKYPRL